MENQKKQQKWWGWVSWFGVTGVIASVVFWLTMKNPEINELSRWFIYSPFFYYGIAVSGVAFSATKLFSDNKKVDQEEHYILVIMLTAVFIPWAFSVGLFIGLIEILLISQKLVYNTRQSVTDQGIFIYLIIIPFSLFSVGIGIILAKIFDE